MNSMIDDYSPPSPLLKLCRYGFYLSVLLLFYGTLFPFQFDLSPHSLSLAWANAGLVPYWDVHRSRIHSLPDMVSNVLLTIPLGFFGFLWFGRNKERSGIAKWFALGFLLAMLSEIVQLGIPSRLSGITDALNNGLGSFVGAFTAAFCGPKIFDLFSGSLFDKKRTYLVILLAIVIATTLLPFDFGMDVGHIKSSIRQLLVNPWESGIPIDDEWILMAEFALIGALAGSMTQTRFILFALFLPFILEPAQLLVESHAPSLRDLALNLAGVAAGIASARHIPKLVRPATGFILMNIALVVEGLSPYHFAGPSHFEWIPLVEYYNQTTGLALYDAMAGLLSYGLLVALWPRRSTVLWAVLLAGGIEATQIFIPARFSGTTDIIIAAIGGWTGYVLSKSATNSTNFTNIRADQSSLHLDI
jgi:glycopeptide antibiotics resistance protein